MKHGIQELIHAAEDGNARAGEQLFAALYDELHRLAESNLRRGGAPNTLGATTLLHEAYLNLADREGLAFPDRARFMGYAARAMRGLVIDYARRRQALKRGRRFEITLVENETPSQETQKSVAELERVGDALDELATLEPALAQLVDLHFFAGYTFGEIASLRGVSERTVQRDWRKARLLLQQTLLTDSEPIG
jgi:RNA polymerase sigma factor (TIGR02999 family)